MEESMASLTEMNQAAAEKASTVLSKLIDRSVAVAFSTIGVKKIADLCPFIPPKDIVMGIVLPIVGEIRGVAMLILPEDFTLTIVDILTGKRSRTIRQLTELEESALKEVGNVITGAYLTVLCDMSGVRLVERIPVLIHDTFECVISEGTRSFLEDPEEAMVGAVELAFESATVRGYFLLLLEDGENVFDRFTYL